MAQEIDVYDRLREMALPASERNAVVNFDELVGANTVAEIPNPYRVIENKDELIGKGFYVREAVLKAPEESDNDAAYCILYCILPTNEMVIITDGGTGIYVYMRDAIQKRLDQGIADATQGFYFPNGLRKSEYAIDADGKPIARGDTDTKRKGTGTTYYFA